MLVFVIVCGCLSLGSLALACMFFFGAVQGDREMKPEVIIALLCAAIVFGILSLGLYNHYFVEVATKSAGLIPGLC